MALAKVTEGGAAFHNHTYQQRTARILQWIVDDARLARLHLVDEDGRPGTFDEILERARNDGACFDVGGRAPATALELNTCYGLVLFSTLEQLNEWGGPRGDEFYLGETGERPIEEGDKPLHGKERDTRALVLNATLQELGIRHDERGAATKIEKLTDMAGVHVDHGTIEPVLAEIPPAIERRKK